MLRYTYKGIKLADIVGREVEECLKIAYSDYVHEEARLAVIHRSRAFFVRISQ